MKEFDEIVKGFVRSLRQQLRPFSSSSKQGPESSHLDQVIVEDYFAESTKFQFFQVSEKLRFYYEAALKLLKLLSTELQRDFKMKEEEASLFIVLTFFLIALLSLQLLVFLCSRYARYRQRPA